MSDIFANIEKLGPEKRKAFERFLEKRSTLPLIAVIGMAGRFPGAGSVAELWVRIRAQEELIRFLSKDELSDLGYAALATVPGFVPAVSWLDRITEFDEELFGYTPKEAQLIDPQHRLFLECAWEALEDAGYAPRSIRSSVAVYASAALNDHFFRLGRASQATLAFQNFISSDKDFIAARTSYKLNLRGPSITVQSACSSSLVAVHEAVRALRAGDCDMALAGGVSVQPYVEPGYRYQEGMIHSPDGHCRTFGEAAAGTIFGEGVGVVVLKRLSDAIAQGDRIAAVIRGSSVNNDGSEKIGFTAPSVQGQVDVLRRAFKDANVDAKSLSYIEAHGTGTPLGDPIEVEALRQVFGSAREKTCAIGSVKSNAGHLDTAAGIAGFIKTVLALSKETLPPSLHAEPPNSKLRLDESPFFVPRRPVPWRRGDTPRRAGVSAFGIGGTNAHVVLEESPAPAERASDPHPHLLVWSARNREGAAVATRRILRALRDRNTDVGDASYTLAVGRERFAHRRAIDLVPEDISRGQAWDSRILEGEAPKRPPGVEIWIPNYSGLSTPLHSELYLRLPVFREILDHELELSRLDGELAQSIRSALEPVDVGNATSANLRREGLRLASSFLVRRALARLVLDLGVSPVHLAGHGLGELVAASLAGVLPTEVCVEGLVETEPLMVSAGHRALAVRGPPGRVAELAASVGVRLVAIHDAHLSVVSGSPDRVADAGSLFFREGMRTQALAGDLIWPPIGLPRAAELWARLLVRGVTSAPVLPLLSLEDGQLLASDAACDAAHWIRRIAEPIRLDRCLPSLNESSAEFLVEVGAPTGLLDLLRSGRSTGVRAVSLLPRRQGFKPPGEHGSSGDHRHFLRAIGRLWCAGVPMELGPLHRGANRRRIALPTYPFQRKTLLPDGLPVRAKSDVARSHFEVTWREVALDADRIAPSAGTWITCGEPGPLHDSLRRAMVDRGFGVESTSALGSVSDSSGLAEWEFGSPSQVLGVVVLAAEGWPEPRSPGGGPTDAVTEGLSRLIAIARRIRTTPAPSSPRLFVVTRGASLSSPVLEEALPFVPWLGLGRVLSLELPDVFGSSIDLDPARGDPPHFEANRVLDEISADSDETEVSYRDRRRWVPRLVPSEALDQDDPIDFSRGAFVISGGLGGVGLELATWLSRRGARSIALLSRRSASEVPGAEDKIREMESLGTKVMSDRVDVADAEALDRTLSSMRRQGLSIRGVFHAAGTLGTGAALDLSKDQIRSVLRPKVGGAWNLHCLTRVDPIDLFVLFSSGASVWGGAGLAPYAAANAYLDGLASWRRSLGLHALAVNFGPFGEVGMVGARDRDDLDRIGLRALPTALGLRQLDLLMRSGRSAAVIADFDFRRFKSVFESKRRRTLLREIHAPNVVHRATVGSLPDVERDGPGRSSSLLRWNRGEISERLRAIVRSALGVEDSAFKDQTVLKDVGLDSFLALGMRDQIQDAFRMELPATTLFEYPSIERIADFLLLKLADHRPGPRPLLEGSARSTGAWGPDGGTRTPIAIVGMSCRFPGAEDPEAFWRLVRSGAVAIREAPQDRWDLRQVYDPTPATPGKTYVRHGGFVADIDRFDPGFFGISLAEASVMDPQQRLLLMLVEEALERAGIRPRSLVEGPVGVFVGITHSEYGRIVRQAGATGPYVATGSVLNAAAGRISYVFDLRGPAEATDTACSSALVALHRAHRALISGEVSLAIVAGVNSMLTPDGHILLSQTRALASDGRSKTFDAKADGYGRSEGAGVVVLKPVVKATEDGNPILGIVRATAVNQDGRSQGFTSPNGLAQQAVIETALREAGLSVDDIGYIEAHGTGTSLGDPQELGALGEVFRGAQKRIPVGSVKANIGHLESAAGIASIIKVILALRHGEIPPHAGLEQLNPHIPLGALPLQIPTEVRPWPRARPDGTRIAGISSFGFSGTNAHVLLSEGTKEAREAQVSGSQRGVLRLSARSERALRAMGSAYARHLRERPHISPWRAGDSTIAGKDRHSLALAAVGRTREGLIEDLDRIARGAGTPRPVNLERAPLAAFVFSGFDGDTLRTGRALRFTFEAFGSLIDRAGDAIRSLGLTDPRRWLDDDGGGEAPSALDLEILGFCRRVGLANALRFHGVEPSACFGHGSGELAAAHVAGAFSLEDAIRILIARHHLMASLRGEIVSVAIHAATEVAQAMLEGSARSGSLVAMTTAHDVVVSIRRVDFPALAEYARAHRVPIKETRAPVPSASFLSDPLLRPFRAMLADLPSGVCSIPFFSELEGALSDPSRDPSHWSRHLAGPSSFERALQQAEAAQIGIYFELDHRPILTALARLAGHGGTWIRVHDPSDEVGALLHAIGAWVELGGRIATKTCIASEWAPTYPFELRRCWVEPRAGAHRTPEKNLGHPLFGLRIPTPTGLVQFTRTLSLAATPYLAQHVVETRQIMPGTAFVEMALASGRRVLGTKVELEDITFERPLVLAEQKGCRVAVVLEAGSGRGVEHGVRNVSIFSAPLEDSLESSGWIRHAAANVRIAPRASSQASSFQGGPAEFECRSEVSVARLYERMAAGGLEYGAMFRALGSAWVGDRGSGRALGRLTIDPSMLADLGSYDLHPVIADACTHVVSLAHGTLIETDDDRDLFLPFAIGRVLLEAPSSAPLWSLAEVQRISRKRIQARIRAWDDRGRAVFELDRFEFKALDRSRRSTVSRRATAHTVVWHPVKDPSRTARALPAKIFLIPDTFGVARELVNVLGGWGASCRLLSSTEAGALQDVESALEIVDLSPLDALKAPTTEDAVELTARLSERLLDLLRALEGRTTPPSLVLVTSGVVPASKVGSVSSLGALAQATLFGLARVLRREFPDVECRSIDLDDPRDGGVAALANELAEVLRSGLEDRELAISNGSWRVPRLLPLAPSSADARQQIRGDSTYLVSGGLGALGLRTTERLIDAGAKSMVLMGRGLPSAEVQCQIDAWRNAGTSVEIVHADVADREAVRGVVERIDRSGRRLAGVIHAAGVLEDSTLRHLDRDRLRRVFRPKIGGAWNLHLETRDRPIDCFVLFSSIAGVFGASGQANYAAANTFLDALAQHRRSIGLPGLSIAWGAWRDLGMAARVATEARARWAGQGVHELEPDAALDWFEALLPRDEAQVVVTSIDWETFLTNPGSASPFFENLRTQAAHGGAAARVPVRANVGAVASAFAASLEGLLKTERLERTRSLVRQTVLGLLVETSEDAIPDDRPLTELGLDSLGAVELRNRLMEAVGQRFPPSLAYDHPTVGELAEHLLRAISPDAPPAPPNVVGIPPSRDAAPIGGLAEELALVRATLDRLQEGQD